MNNSNNVDDYFLADHEEMWGSPIKGLQLDIGLLWVTKCCSSYFRKITNNLRVDCNTCDVAIVVLRDPIERYISGLIHYRTVRKISYEEWKEQADRGKVYFDVHTIPQVRFLKNLTTPQVDYFLYSDTVIDEISNKYYFNWQNFKVNDKRENLKKYQYQVESINYFRNNPNYLDTVKQLFKDDYHLVKKKFPNHNFKNFNIWDDKHLEDWR